MIPPSVFNAFQTKEIAEHKWYCSEKEGRDLGEEAIFHWALFPDYENSQAARFRRAFREHEPRVLELCMKYCRGYENCMGMEHCPVTKDEVHWALEDSPAPRS